MTEHRCMCSRVNTEQANSRTSAAVGAVWVKTRVVRDVTPCRCAPSWRRFEPPSAYGTSELSVCDCLSAQVKTAQSYPKTRRHVPEHLSLPARTSQPTQKQLTCDEYRRPGISRNSSVHPGRLSQRSASPRPASHCYPRPVHYPN